MKSCGHGGDYGEADGGRKTIAEAPRALLPSRCTALQGFGQRDLPRGINVGKFLIKSWHGSLWRQHADSRARKWASARQGMTLVDDLSAEGVAAASPYTVFRDNGQGWHGAYAGFGARRCARTDKRRRGQEHSP
eukprot:1095277-Rhodomonas_salina.1